MIIAVNAQRVDSESVKYRILSMLEQLAAERRQWSREHAEYRHRGRTAAMDRMADSVGIPRREFYDALEGRTQFTPLQRQNIAKYLTVSERDIWYGRPIRQERKTESGGFTS